jgi:hypothetical protein
MSANHCEEKLLEFAYGELSPAEANSVEVHLSSCAHCSGALQSIRQVRKVMSQLPLGEPSSAGMDSLLSYAQQAARRGQSGSSRSIGWKKWLVPTTGLAAAAVVAVVSTQVFRVQELSPPRTVIEDYIAEKHAGAPGLSAEAPGSVPANDAEAVPSRKLGKQGAAAPKPAAPQASQYAPSREGDSVEKRTALGGEQMGAMRSRKRLQAPENLGGAPPQPPAGDNLAAKMDRRDFAPQAATESGSRWAAEARQAKLAGDRTREVELLRQALAAGAQGAKRAELLSRLCDALDSVGNQAEADSVCEKLIREFPTSQEAKAASSRPKQDN